jgi:hypothetical protein
MNLLHALFTRNRLMSGVAIVRYIPRAFGVKQVDGNLFFTGGKREEYRRRVEGVTPQSLRQWGITSVHSQCRSHSKRLLMGYRKPDRGARFQFTLRLQVRVSSASAGSLI